MAALSSRGEFILSIRQFSMTTNTHLSHYNFFESDDRIKSLLAITFPGISTKLKDSTKTSQKWTRSFDILLRSIRTKNKTFRWKTEKSDVEIPLNRFFTCFLFSETRSMIQGKAILGVVSGFYLSVKISLSECGSIIATTLTSLKPSLKTPCDIPTMSIPGARYRLFPHTMITRIIKIIIITTYQCFNRPKMMSHKLCTSPRDAFLRYSRSLDPQTPTFPFSLR